MQHFLIICHKLISLQAVSDKRMCLRWDNMSNFGSFRQGISRSQYGTGWGEQMLKLNVIVCVFKQDEKRGTCWCLMFCCVGKSAVSFGGLLEHRLIKLKKDFFFFS